MAESHHINISLFLTFCFYNALSVCFLKRELTTSTGSRYFVFIPVKSQQMCFALLGRKKP